MAERPPPLIGARLGTGLSLFPLLPAAGWEKVPIAGKLAQPAQAWLRGRMRAGARKRDGLASGTTAPLRVAALIRRFAPPSPTQERGRRGSLRRKLAPMGVRRDDGFMGVVAFFMVDVARPLLQCR